MGTSIDYCPRYSVESLEKSEVDENGRLFLLPAGAAGAGYMDLSDFQIVGRSVDTVRQLYKGTLRPDLLERIKKASEHQDIFDLGGGIQWIASRISKVSGYQYKLQNNEFGFVVLIKSVYRVADSRATHLKIEASPHIIRALGDDLQDHMNEFAYLLMYDDWEHAGCAVHLAVDFQGWQPQDDFFDCLKTRARTFRQYNAIGETHMENISATAVKYNLGESFLIGKATALQMALYDKSTEVQISDKEDYFKELWNASGLYDDSRPVWRVEARVSHLVAREVGEFMESGDFQHYAGLSRCLNDLWEYALRIHRLHLSARSKCVHPVWVLLGEADFEKGLHVILKRKKKQSLGNVGKNISLMLGNMITICAREGQSAAQVLENLKRLDIWDTFKRYYHIMFSYDEGSSLDTVEEDLLYKIEEGLVLRRLVGNCA